MLRDTGSGGDREGSIYAEVQRENAILMAPYTWYPQRQGRVDLVIPRARETGRIEDPVLRQEIAKLLILARTAEWTARRARTDALLTGPESPEQGVIAEIFVSVPAISIAGGTDEIQKNIISERVLGMDKEPRFDQGPFRDVRRN